METCNRKDGFEGEKMIDLPETVCEDFCRMTPAFSQFYITHMGYFPHAERHYIRRSKGCEDNILIYCLHGKGYCSIGRYHFDILPNQYLILPTTSDILTYWADSDEPWTIYWVHFTGPSIESFNQSLNIFGHKGPVTFPLNRRGLSVWEEMYTCLTNGLNIDNVRHANLCLHHFIASFLYPDPGVHQKDDEDQIAATINYMEGMVDSRITVEALAERLKLSTSHFSAIFRKATGMPPMDYFIQLKMQKACQLLYLNNMKVKEVAEAIGYEDPFYFSRQFKKHMKVSPLLYKEASKRILA